MGAKAAKALALVFLLLVAIWLSGRVVGDGSDTSSDAGSLQVAMVQGEDRELSEALEFAQSLGFYGSVDMYGPGESAAQVPSGFEEELLSLGSFPQVFVATGRNLVGFGGSSDAGALYDQCVSELQGKGWVAVPSGQENQCTLVKESGMYTWAYLVCSDVTDGSMGALSFQSEQGDDQG